MKIHLKMLALTLAILLPTNAAHARVVEHSTHSSQGDTINYRLFQPNKLSRPRKTTATQPADDMNLPLVLFLHGSGDRGLNRHIEGLISKTATNPYRSYLLFPDALANQGWASWGETPTDSMRLTLEIVDQLVDSGKVDPDRIYITGLSLGGFGVFDAVFREPNKFAAAIPFSGGAPSNPEFVSNLLDTPIWAFHGSNDGAVNVQYTRDVMAEIDRQGGDGKYTELPGAGHVIWDPIYRDLTTSASEGQLYDWMFSHSIPEPSSLALITLLSAAILKRKQN